MKSLFLILLLPLIAQGQGFDAGLDGTQPMTDKEEYEADNYIHQGKANRIYEEECFNEDGTFKEICEESNDSAWDSGTMKTVESMMPIVGKMYAVIGLMGMMKGGDSDAGKVKMKGDKKAEVDYCKFIPMGLEVAALATQKANNNQTLQNYQGAKPEAEQRASFNSLSKMHQDKSKQSKVQGIGWYSTAGCYATYVASGAALDAKMIAKLGAAALIGSFYVMKEKAHKNKAEKISAMADKLPGAGDCNPHTDTTCFCKEERSYGSDPTNFMKYCVPPELARDKNQIGSSCVDASGKADVSCKCKKTNSCIHAKLTHDALRLGLNPAQMKDPLSGVSHLSSGVASGKLQAIGDRNLAMAKEVMKKYKPKEKISLNSKKAKDLAKELFKAGLPKAVAATLASEAAGLDGELPQSAGSIASFGSAAEKVEESFNKGTNKKTTGGSIGGTKSSFSKSSNPFARNSRGSSSRTASVDIMDFADKATREAEINKDKSKPLFEIITYRYKMRAWKEFEEEMRENMTEN